MSICLITNDINLHHIGKEVSAEFLHMKLIFFPLELKFLKRSYLKTGSTSVSPETAPLHTDWWRPIITVMFA